MKKKNINVRHPEQSEGCFKILRDKSLRMTGMCESGRSMVEMLGVLAIIGILSVMGILGTRKSEVTGSAVHRNRYARFLPFCP